MKLPGSPLLFIRHSVELTKLTTPARSRLAGGKGTQRKKVVAKARAGSGAEDKKLSSALKKLNVTSMTG